MHVFDTLADSECFDASKLGYNAAHAPSLASRKLRKAEALVLSLGVKPDKTKPTKYRNNVSFFAHNANLDQREAKALFSPTAPLLLEYALLYSTAITYYVIFLLFNVFVKLQKIYWSRQYVIRICMKVGGMAACKIAICIDADTL